MPTLTLTTIANGERISPGLALLETTVCRARSGTARCGFNFPRHNQWRAPMISKPSTMPCAEEGAATP